MNVSALMDKTVIACRADEPVAAAATRMWDYERACLPVVDEANRLVGVLYERDALAAMPVRDAGNGLDVSSVMSRERLLCKPSDPVAQAVRLMDERRLRWVPVVDEEGHLDGGLSFDDVARELPTGRRPTRTSGHPIPTNKLWPMGR